MRHKMRFDILNRSPWLTNVTDGRTEPPLAIARSNDGR